MCEEGKAKHQDYPAVSKKKDYGSLTWWTTESLPLPQQGTGTRRFLLLLKYNTS
jgi:hypothetical protein